MPQESIFYAAGRLSVIEANALTRQKVDRLLSAKDANEVRQMLLSFGWPSEGTDEENALEHVNRASKLVMELATDEDLVNVFLFKNDITNIKILVKAKSLDTRPELLSKGGTIDLETLKDAIDNKDYSVLPKEVVQALNKIDSQLMGTSYDPMQTDILLDRAYFEYALRRLPKREKTAKEYFVRKADTSNYAMAIRSMHAQKPFTFLKDILLPGGRISEKQWEKAYEKAENLPLLLNNLGTKLYNAAIAAYIEPKKLAAFEKHADDALLELFLPFRRQIDKNERLIGHLLMRSREAAAVRLILAGKENGFSHEAILERLRELYAR
ncbi:MAG: V-type ATPase subunit [Eubacteriales bacterium]|nr:V-type ATPase subunit [Eubacteriales bacterium]